MTTPTRQRRYTLTKDLRKLGFEVNHKKKEICIPYGEIPPPECRMENRGDEEGIPLQ